MSAQTTVSDQPSMVAAQNTQRQNYVFDNREGGNACMFECFGVVCVYSVCIGYIGTCEVWCVWYGMHILCAYVVCAYACEV